MGFNTEARTILAKSTGRTCCRPLEPNISNGWSGKGTIVAVHSYKGGTGKTLISANLATLFAAKGDKTCYLDMDFFAPSLYSLFLAEQPDYWLNDYLNGACKAEKVLRNVCYKGIEKEKLFIGYANPSTEAIREIGARDRKWEIQALDRLLSLRDSLLGELGFEYLIIDTSPGLHYSSINAIIAADISLVVATLNESDLEGTLTMLHDLYGLFEKKTAVLVNKLSSGSQQSEIMQRLKNGLNSFKLVFCSFIACSCDITLSEKQCFYACQKPSYPFSGTLQEIASMIAAHQS